MTTVVPDRIRAQAELILRQRRQRGGGSLSIPEGMGFRAWCESLAADGLKVDRHPFTLANRRALWEIYDLIPSTVEAAYDKIIVLRKGAQMGLTIWECLADLYMALKFSPMTIAMYVPDSKLAPYKSEHRFMPIVRSIPSVYQCMTAGARGEGNVLTRTIDQAIFLFLWTTGATMTESFPADVVSFDEVQNMSPAQISTVRERLSASGFRFTMLLSTPKWQGEDIDFWYVQGTQHQFWTRCPHCREYSVLTDFVPEQIDRVIRFDPATDDYRYACPACSGWIVDPQDGEWRAQYPERRIISYHLSQILSPTVSPAQVRWEWLTCQTGTQKQSFYNRKLGKPYTDPSQIPITAEVLQAAVEEGVRRGVTWQAAASGTWMGIDQMGGFNCVVVKARLPDGCQAVIHVEAVYDLDPFERCAALMDVYGVAVCVLESLPNYNDAKRFAFRFPGRVFLAQYGGEKSDMVTWGDMLTRTDLKTAQESRDRYTVQVQQYKAMQVSLARIQTRTCVFPDPSALTQDVLENGVLRRVALCRDVVFLHLQRVALVVEQDQDARKTKAVVKKVGIDPHFAYANMLCDVAWARNHGTGVMMLPQTPGIEATTIPGFEGLPDHVVTAIQEVREGTCLGCAEFQDNLCTLRGLVTQAHDVACDLFMPRS